MKVKIKKIPGNLNNHEPIHSVNMENELKNGIKVESEHGRTLAFIKDYNQKYGRLPSKLKLAKSIAVDHIEDFKNAPNGKDKSYYSSLINNGLTDEVSKYAFGGSISPLDVSTNKLEQLRKLGYGGDTEIPPSNDNGDYYGNYNPWNYNNNIDNPSYINTFPAPRPNYFGSIVNQKPFNNGNDVNVGEVKVTPNEYLNRDLQRNSQYKPLLPFNSTPPINKSYNNINNNDNNKDNKFKTWWENLKNNNTNNNTYGDNTKSKLDLNLGELAKTGLSNLGGLYDIYRGLKGGNPESYSRLAPLEMETLNPDRNIAQMKELSNYSRKQMNNVGGQGLGQYLNNLSDLNSNTQKQMANIISNYDQQNVGIRNQNQQLNRDIDAKNIAMDVQQNEINAKERDTARNALQHGLTQLGEGFGQQFQDSAQRKAQDFAITSLMEKNNYDYIPDNEGGYIMTSKTDKNKQYRIDIYGNVYDMDGTLLGDKSILNTPTE